MDVVGGCFLVALSGIGWYAVQLGMDISWILCLFMVLGCLGMWCFRVWGCNY